MPLSVMFRSRRSKPYSMNERRSMRADSRLERFYGLLGRLLLGPRPPLSHSSKNRRYSDTDTG